MPLIGQLRGNYRSAAEISPANSKTKTATAIKVSIVTMVTILSPQVGRLTALIFFP